MKPQSNSRADLLAYARWLASVGREVESADVLAGLGVLAQDRLTGRDELSVDSNAVGASRDAVRGVGVGGDGAIAAVEPTIGGATVGGKIR